ncbi:MAG: hypothetical protein IKO39_00240 [Treponema sp.]|nr:hypothetical protein [Treponema sp.]
MRFLSGDRQKIFTRFFSARKCSARIFFLLPFFLAFGFIYSQNELSFPSLEPLFSFKDGELSSEDLILSGLEFSFCPADSDLAKESLEKFRALEEQVKSDAFMVLSEEERGEKILSLIYENTLRQYSLNQTYIDVMFQKGTYNCVSASILYYALAKSAALKVHAVETPDHAFCTLYLSDGRKIDVETTNPNGFNPGTKKNLQSNANSTRYQIVPKKYYSNRHEISERKFISLVGKNASAMLDEKRDYKKAVPLAAARIDFTEDCPKEDKKAVRIDFDTVAMNYAVLFDRQKKSDPALDWLDLVENRWGKAENQPFYQNTYESIAYNCAANLTNQKQAGTAQKIFDLHKEKISEKNRDVIEGMIFYALIDEQTKKVRADEAISLIQEKKSAPQAKDAAISRKLIALEEYYWAEKAKALSKDGKFLEAAEILSEGLKSLPNSRNLQTIRNQNMNNYAVNIHNQFADLFNAKKLDEAEALLNEGLKIVPKNGTLQRDLQILRSRK